ncbi:Uncharacterised protein [Serratia fonticola]|uniref:Uncharacterized protein n=1 Tax=Serratia fonticola TaxID=47917 RepID=A0A4U9UEL9_SERFO|nr:Uncharacterised protein [Serratia fonticola]
MTPKRSPVAISKKTVLATGILKPALQVSVGARLTGNCKSCM